MVLYKSGLVVNKKSEFKDNKVIFLGHRITHSAWLPAFGRKIHRTSENPNSEYSYTGRRFLGMIIFHRKFIPHASEIQQPLTALTRKGAQFTWTTSCQDAFEKLVQLAIHAAQLLHPSPSPAGLFAVIWFRCYYVTLVEQSS